VIAKAGSAFRTAWPLTAVGLAVAANGVWNTAFPGSFTDSRLATAWLRNRSNRKKISRSLARSEYAPVST
jgi:hypothetical protein